jgi:hypothetical protein
MIGRTKLPHDGDPTPQVRETIDRERFVGKVWDGGLHGVGRGVGLEIHGVVLQ